MSVRFGPAGNAASFPFKSTVLAPEWLSEMGLNAYEYQCGRGVHIGDDTAGKIGEEAQKYNIALSLHTPYFINLCSADKIQAEKNISYVLKSARAAKQMGAKRMVVHCGGLCGLTREEALRNTVVNLEETLQRLSDTGYPDITLCIETMGKINVLGTTQEVAEICLTSPRLMPCIDFGHVNARTKGGIVSQQDAERELIKLENVLGFERVRNLHIHFSRIEFSNGGEVRHLTYDDTRFGPDFHPVAGALKARGYEPVIICESAGTQAEDSVTFQKIWEGLL
ncbi:MAG: TIM barrel protein [Clostridiales bacterium]|nr:TIM barrel protein [Clostridiales bacterium]